MFQNNLKKSERAKVEEFSNEHGILEFLNKIWSDEKQHNGDPARINKQNQDTEHEDQKK